MTIRDLARYPNVNSALTKRIQNRFLKKTFGRPKLQPVRIIAIVGIHRGLDVQFATVLLNLVAGAALFVGKSRGTEALRPFWKRLGMTSFVLLVILGRERFRRSPSPSRRG